MHLFARRALHFAAIAMVGFCLVAPSAAFAEVIDAPRISGRVIDASGAYGGTGDAVAGATITVYRRDETGAWLPAGSVTTDASGFYDAAVARGFYRVGVAHPAEGWLPTFFGSATNQLGDAHDILISTGTRTCCFSLRGACTISGRVVDSQGLPLRGVSVQDAFYQRSGGLFRTIEGTVTGIDGAFTLSGVFPGTHRVHLSGPYYLDAWVGEDAQHPNGVETVVSSGTVDLGEVTIRRHPVIRGRVVDESGTPIPSAQVDIYQETPGSSGWFLRDSVVAGADGVYAFQCANANPTRVRFIGTSDTIQEYFGGATLLTARIFEMSPDASYEGVDATLAVGATIGGSLRNGQTGLGVEQTQVYLDRLEGNTWTQVGNADVFPSTFTLSRLEPGTYRVSVSGYTGALQIGRIYFGDTPYADLATPIVLTSGDKRTIRITGFPGASLSGYATSAQSGWSVDGVTATLYQKLANGWRVADTRGWRSEYNFVGPYHGTYRLVIADDLGRYHPRGWPSGTSFDTAPDFALDGGESLDVSVVMQPILGVVSGTVISDAGYAVPGARVDIYQMRRMRFGGYEERLARSTFASVGGTWLTGLESGEYRIEVSDPLGDHSTALVGSVRLPGLSVMPLQTTVQDMTLYRRCTIEGTVRDGVSGVPVVGLRVWGSGGLAASVTDAQGHYRLTKVDHLPVLKSLGYSDPQGRYDTWPVGLVGWLSPGEVRSFDATLAPIARVMLTTTSRRSLAYGAMYSISGRLVGGGAVLPAQRVCLQAAVPGGQFGDTGLVATTTAEGAFAFGVRPKVKTYYRVRYDGDPAYQSSVQTDCIYANPQVLLTNMPHPTTLAVGRVFYFKGYITPAHSVGDPPVAGRLYRKWSDGKYHYVTLLRGRLETYSDSKSRYGLSARLYAKGRWKLVPYHPGDATNAPTLGTPVFVTVE